MTTQNSLNTKRTFPLMLDEAIADILRESIFRHELIPGSIVNQFDLAKKYAISRAVLRDSLKLLAKEGLVDLGDKSQYVLINPDWNSVSQLLDLLHLHEGYAIRMACRNGLSNFKKEGFFSQVISGINNPYIGASMQGLLNKLQLVFGLAWHKPNVQISLEQWFDLVDAILMRKEEDGSRIWVAYQEMRKSALKLIYASMTRDTSLVQPANEETYSGFMYDGTHLSANMM